VGAVPGISDTNANSLISCPAAFAELLSFRKCCQQSLTIVASAIIITVLAASSANAQNFPFGLYYNQNFDDAFNALKKMGPTREMSFYRGAKLPPDYSGKGNHERFISVLTEVGNIYLMGSALLVDDKLSTFIIESMEPIMAMSFFGDNHRDKYDDYLNSIHGGSIDTRNALQKEFGSPLLTDTSSKSSYPYAQDCYLTGKSLVTFQMYGVVHTGDTYTAERQYSVIYNSILNKNIEKIQFGDSWWNYQPPSKECLNKVKSIVK
jgi:hypothetical protein